MFRNGEFELSITPHAVDGFRVVASGVARALGFRDAARLVESIPDAEKGYAPACTPGGDQRVWYLTEAGFYRALGQRQVARIRDAGVRAMVERFQAWVYREVLPGLRAGRLVSAPQPPVPFQPLSESEERRRLALSVLAAEDALDEARSALADAEASVAELRPRAALADAFLSAEGDYSTREAAQILARKSGLDIGRGRLYRQLRALGWIDRKNQPYQKHVDAGRIRLRASTYRHPETGVRVAAPSQLRVTPKGIADLHSALLAGQQMVLFPGELHAWSGGR